MLPPAARLRRPAEFRAALRGGSRAGRPLISGHLLVRPADEPARVGFVVSRKVGPAVVRNRVKRQLRHLARGRLSSLPGGSLLVLRANPRAATARQEDLAAELDLVISALLRRQDRARCP
jgi:ribonuclease P protein component